MTIPCEKLAAFWDRELPAAEAEAFRLHLARCSACAAALHDHMMLSAIAGIHRADLAARGSPGPSRTTALRRWGPLVSALALAAGVLGFVLHHAGTVGCVVAAATFPAHATSDPCPQFQALSGSEFMCECAIPGSAYSSPSVFVRSSGEMDTSWWAPPVPCPTTTRSLASVGPRRRSQARGRRSPRPRCSSARPARPTSSSKGRTTRSATTTHGREPPGRPRRSRARGRRSPRLVSSSGLPERRTSRSKDRAIRSFSIPRRPARRGRASPWGGRGPRTPRRACSSAPTERSTSWPKGPATRSPITHASLGARPDRIGRSPAPVPPGPRRRSTCARPVRPDVVATGASKSLEYLYANPGSAWSTYTIAGSGTTASAPSIFVRSTGEADIVTQGTGGTLEYYYAWPGSVWSHSTIAGAGTTFDQPAIFVRPSGEADVVAVGVLASLWYYAATPGSAWAAADPAP